MQLVMGDQYNFSLVSAVGPHSTSIREVASASTLNELARELSLLVEHLRASNADYKSESVLYATPFFDAKQCERQ
jgi:hypothetical protein